MLALPLQPACTDLSAAGVERMPGVCSYTVEGLCLACTALTSCRHDPKLHSVSSQGRVPSPVAADVRA